MSEEKSFQEIAEGVLDQTLAANTPTPETTDAGAAVPAGEVAGDQTAETVPSLRERLTGLGFEFSEDDTDDAAAQRLYDAYAEQAKNYEQLQQQIEYLKLQQLYGSQTQQTPTANTSTTSHSPAAQVDSTAAKWWNPPVVDEHLVRQFASPGEDGSLVWRPEAPLSLRASYEARQQYINDFATRFVQDPEAALAPLLQQNQQSIQQMIEQAISQVQQAQQVQSVVDSFVQKNESWLYQMDPVTNKPKQDRGNPVLSEAGHNFNAIYSSLLERGLDEPTALAAAEGLYYQRHGQKEATRQQISQNRVAHVVNGSANAAARNGHQSAVAAGKLRGKAAQTNESFEEIFARHLYNGAGDF